VVAAGCEPPQETMAHAKDAQEIPFEMAFMIVLR
jgi:hypothetical protein